MVQGKTKGLRQSRPSSRHAHKAAANTKKGKRAVPPKHPALAKHASIKQRLSANINRSIEAQMVSAASAGKLTIMKNTAPEPEPSGSRPKTRKQ